MNDPHVVALLYKIAHGPSVDYLEAEPLDHDETGFHVTIAKELVRFDFKDHYATQDAARKAIDAYIRVWELDAGLHMGPNSFQLRFKRAHIVDRNPTPGVVSISAHFRAGAPEVTVNVTVSRRRYPPPPSGLSLTPDVQTMYDRYMGYRQGKEPLASMVYFCLTVLQHPGGRRNAVNTYGIDLRVLGEVGRLSTSKGGQKARKALGKDTDLSDEDRCFLEEAVKAIIRRVAETAYDPNRTFPTISMPHLSPLKT